MSILLEGLTIAKLHFVLEIGRAAHGVDDLLTEFRLYRTAFASYATEDRDEVLRIIQGIQKIAPRLDVFLDVLTLRAGPRWQDELWHAIPTRDVFYLFWSRAARRSAWVEAEWRCALSARGPDFIDPAPLEPPDVAPPPAELQQDVHFNDWTLAFRRRGPTSPS